MALSGAVALALVGLWAFFATFMGMESFALDFPAAGPGAGAYPGAGLGSDLEALRASNRALRAELDLVEAAEPYLVLDLAGGQLTLKSHGAVLREFPVEPSEFRTRRAPGYRSVVSSPLDTIWADGTLLPPRVKKRVVILSDSVSEPDLSGAVSYIPPTPEEEFPQPELFRLRFSRGLSLFVRGGWDGEGAEDGSGPNNSSASDPVRPTGLRAWVLGMGGLVLWARLDPWDPGAIQVDLRMTGEEAGALYRALSDGMPLLVVGADRVLR